MKKNKKFLNKLTEIKEDIIVGVPLITQVSNNKIIIENYKSILGVLDHEVKISTSVGTLTIIGKDIVMREMTSETIIIEGKIRKSEII